ncbi:MAG: DUF2167 domain-containing protein [Pseudomonadota bacterium]
MKKYTLFALFYFLFTAVSFAKAAESQSQSIPLTTPPVTSTIRANEDPKVRLELGFKAAQAALKKGPIAITLADQATLKLPENFGFIPKPAASQLMEALGNRVTESLQGLIVSLDDKKADFMMIVSYVNTGYIKDDEAKSWNPDDILESIRTGNEEMNTERKAKGITEIEIIDWVEKPHYDNATHQLVWSLASQDKGVGADINYKGINYNTLTLGREGYVSMNLVTEQKSIEGLKPIAKSLLLALTFNEGKRYSDFSASTDRVAEYGLAALITGVAAKKLGLFAVIAAFLAKFAKVAFIAAMGGFSVIKKMFNRNKTQNIASEENVQDNLGVTLQKQPDASKGSIEP